MKDFFHYTCHHYSNVSFEGYTGSGIKSASGGGETVLYILPLQGELDLSPLQELPNSHAIAVTVIACH